MVITLLLFTLPILTSCSNDGNIHLLEEDIALALRTCYVNDKTNQDGKRQRRTSENIHENPLPRIDANSKQEMNQYNHEKRNLNYNKMDVVNGSNSAHGNRAGNDGVNFVNNTPRPTNNNSNSTRIKRNEPLIRKDDNEECLGQCVFANLQVVDSKGIPREAELWNKVQSSVSSQQSRTLLRDQVHACFQELQSESEDNGCYYSNKLEKCLMLRFSDRIVNRTRTN